MIDTIELERRITEVDTAPTTNFVEFVRISQLDPATDFQNIDLRGADFTDCDLAGFNFTGSNLSGAVFIRTNMKGAVFDDNQRNSPEISEHLLSYNPIDDGNFVLSIAPGNTTQRVLNYLQGHPNLVDTQDVKTAPEGFLLPGSYSVPKGTEVYQILYGLNTLMNQLLYDEWRNRNSICAVENITDSLILSSIIEKESANTRQYRAISSVLSNRIKRRMRLQSMPALYYGLFGPIHANNKNLYKSDIDKDTPYNTYIRKGLPIGPICNPSRDAINAALNPQKTDFLYFSPDGAGGLYFANTLSEHSAHIRMWRESLRNNL